MLLWNIFVPLLIKHYKHLKGLYGLNSLSTYLCYTLHLLFIAVETPFENLTKVFNTQLEIQSTENTLSSVICSTLAEWMM